MPTLRGFFIKGYKIDREKLQKKFGNREDDPENTRFVSLWKHFPHPFKYIDCGKEPGGHISLVVVLEDADERESLEGIDLPSLGGAYDEVFTPGIWVRH